jgi:hypothetical protein
VGQGFAVFSLMSNEKRKIFLEKSYAFEKCPKTPASPAITANLSKIN